MCSRRGSTSGRGFNPHRSRRTGATGRGNNRSRGWQVSILTGPEGPVQLRWRGGCGGVCGFNPHRSRRTGATFVAAAVFGREVFQSSPVPKDRCNAAWQGGGVEVDQFQSSPVPKDRCNDVHRRLWISGCVSILTGPEGPVQRMCSRRGSTCGVAFQSSPVPKDRCNTYPQPPVDSPVQFQSSPVPKDRCNDVQPARIHVRRGFQSSPVPKDRCNACFGRRRGVD